METLGYVAGILTTIAFVPQVLQIYKTKSAKDVSLSMFLLFTLGVFLWLVYGIEAEALPVIIANSVTLILSIVILFFKFRYKETSYKSK
jgi:MtN3 and saliva related transmembrane protein